MNKYELTLVINPNLTDEAYKAEVEKVTETITRFGGVVEKADEWGKRRLAYEINKIAEGFYVIFYFDGEAVTPIELESRLRIDENLLRYLIIRVDA